jgi:hypothetical protein
MGLFFDVVFLLICFFVQSAHSIPPRYNHVPIHEAMQHSIYLHTTKFEEITVSYSERGSELKPGDYLTHADGIRVLNGGLGDFLKSGEKEIIVPIVEEGDEKFGGKRLLGFVLIQPVTPRKISIRRGEIEYDLDEGGPPPTMKLGNVIITNDGAKTTSDPDYSPPAHGGGACITGKDCFTYNGTCSKGQCECNGMYTGTFCQLNRPDFAAVAVRKKVSQQYNQQKEQRQQLKELGMKKKTNDEPLLQATTPGTNEFIPTPSTEQSSFTAVNQFGESEAVDISNKHDVVGKKKKLVTFEFCELLAYKTVFLILGRKENLSLGLLFFEKFNLARMKKSMLKVLCVYCC